MNTNFRTNETIKTIKRTDFDKKVSNWLLNNGFEKKEYDNIYEYHHKELPIAIKPKDERWSNIHLEHYQISFVECVCGKVNGQLTEQFILQNDFGKDLVWFKDKMNKAFDLAQKFIDYVKKQKYIVG